MAKKLRIVWLSITMITFSSISIYADENTQGDFFIPKSSLDEAARVLELERVLDADEEEESRTLIASTEVRKSQEAWLKEKIEKEKIKRQKEEQSREYRQGLAAYIRKVNRNVTHEQSLKYVEYFMDAAKKYNLDEKLIMALAQKESTFYSDATSSEDFKGLMQTGDGIARTAGYEPGDLYNPNISIKVGAKYLKDKFKEFGDRTLALTAYNQGSGSVHSGNYSTGYAEMITSYIQDINNYVDSN